MEALTAPPVPSRIHLGYRQVYMKWRFSASSYFKNLQGAHLALCVCVCHLMPLISVLAPFDNGGVGSSKLCRHQSAPGFIRLWNVSFQRHCFSLQSERCCRLLLCCSVGKAIQCFGSLLPSSCSLERHWVLKPLCKYSRPICFVTHFMSSSLPLALLGSWCSLPSIHTWRFC